jgi:polysaccharide biosynthesis transport protein
MRFSDYLSVVRRWWLVVIAATVAAGLGGSLLAAQQPRLYFSEARVLVGPISTDLNTQRAAGQLALTYSELVASQWLIGSTVARLGLDLDPMVVGESVSASANDITRLLSIRVTDPDPDRAAVLANSLAEELAILGAQAGRPEGQVQVLEAAQPSSRPLSPPSSLIALLAAFIGLVGSLSLVVAFEYLRETLRSAEELRAASGLPILGTVPARFTRRDLTNSVLGGAAADVYRMLSTRLEPGLGTGTLRVLLVLGHQPRARAGVVAAGLALAFADRGIRCALVDADSRQPEASEMMGAVPEPRIAELIDAGRLPLLHPQFVAAPASPRQMPRHVEVAVVPSGARGAVSRRKHIDQTLALLSDVAEIVVIAAPSLDRSPDGLLWAQVADGAVLVLSREGVRRQELATTLEAGQEAGLKLLGIVLSDIDRSSAVSTALARWRRRNRWASFGRALDARAPAPRRSHHSSDSNQR